ncbi:MAG: phosphoribosyl-ATP diphosphatase [Leptospirales bacterium]|nr:phosphoribosyl-ATP diphosphatase [Leptospirales bacterium]
MNIFQNLFDIIEARKAVPPAESYVASLMAGGTEKIATKIIEESVETTEAAFNDERERIVHEICDLLFHTFVLAGYKNISLAEIEKELERRFGTSGLAEKAQRNKQ